MAKNQDKEQPQEVAEADEVVVVSDGIPSTGSAAAPDSRGVDRGEGAEQRREAAQEIARLSMETLDPVTNQPLADFMPNVEGLDEESQALVLGNQRFGSVATRAAALRGTVATRSRAEQRQKEAEDNLQSVIESNPLPETETAQLDPATYRARAFARVQAEARTLTTKTTVPGGRYKVNGEWVNANGDRLDDQSDS